MKRLTLAVLLSAAIFTLPVNNVSSEEFLKSLLIDDFEKGPQLNALQGISGAWTIDPANSKIATTAEIVAIQDNPMGGRSALRLEYSADSEKDALTGYWTLLNNLDAGDYDTLEFYVKGDGKAGFTTAFKIEIKKPKPGSETGEKLAGTKTFRGVTNKWQLVRIPLYSFTGLFDKANPELWKDHSKAFKDLGELVIVFNKYTVTKKKGALYFDNFRLVNTGEDYPTVFDSPSRPAKDKACMIYEDPAFLSKLMVPSADNPDVFKESPAQLAAVTDAETALAGNRGSRVLSTDGKTEYWMHLNDDGRLCFLDSANFTKFLLNRIGGFPSKQVVKKKFSSNDREFLKTIARDTWSFFDKTVDREHGLPLDTILVGPKGLNGPDSIISDYTNITNIGVYLCCVVSAGDLGFITREDAVSRLRKTLETVRIMPAHKSGFLYNYYDTTSPRQTDFLVSFVDSGWLAAGVYVVKNAFPDELGGICRELLSRWDFNFFYDKAEGHMYHGFLENMGDYSDYHYGIFYTEPRLSSFISVARGDVEEAHWYRMARTFPESYNWTTQKPKGRKEKKAGNIPYYGGWYEYKDVKFVPSWGGSMFEALMPSLLIDEKNLAPKGLGANDAAHVKVTIDYSLKTLGYPVWGMSPSSNPEGGYGEFGVKVLGVKGYPPGAVTPHVTFLALDFAPKEAVANLRKMLKGWDIYGEYGFYDALDVKTKKVAYKYLALDQGMILMAINNHLNNGVLKKYFWKETAFQKGERLLNSEFFFE